MSTMYKQAVNISDKLKHKSPDTLRKVADGFKCSLIESSGDSGFISNENLVVSEEIASEDVKSVSEISEKEVSRSFSSRVEEDKEYERLDSGLFRSLSKLKINDNAQRHELEKRKHVAKMFANVPWKTYYQQNSDGDTYLHIAIAEGFVDVALALIKAAPHPRLLDTPNDEAQTPLHLAVETGQWRIVRWLVVAGASPSPRDLKGYSPLHIAAKSGDVKSIRAIVDPVAKQERDVLGLVRKGHTYQSCNLDQWNYLGETCVHIAALHGQVEALRQLIRCGADVNAREGLMGYTALHYAVERRNEATLQFLLQCEKVNVEVESYGGLTAFEVDPILFGRGEALKRSRVSPSFFSDEEDDGDATGSEYSGD